ncbi:hypothetical protein [Caballeronia sp. LZ035]|uniref:hypothetical protein n=1 Tax=Caballeronia sp. LZ035 TaxID=3038568 RepID=UPI0028593C60|nr:hypothetical protein [Caballeronia sp. LZ035]MDR5762959.1 hypothetical protein [Caballeronia sp. LZ035]
MSRNLAPVVKVSSNNGFTANQRVVGQDVEASPPQFYTGRINSVWSDGTAVGPGTIRSIIKPSGIS